MGVTTEGFDRMGKAQAFSDNNAAANAISPKKERIPFTIDAIAFILAQLTKEA